jgi:hypothetical protein
MSIMRRPRQLRSQRGIKGEQVSARRVDPFF